MKKFTLLLFIMCAFSYAQNTVTVEVTGTPPGNYFGYMVVFNSPTDGGGYIFDQPWGVSDLATAVTASSIELSPNVNTYNDNPGDAFWRNNGGAGPDGNKTMTAITYLEDAGGTLNGSDLTFTADITSNDLDNPRYSVIAFIKTVGTGGGFFKSIDLTSSTGVFTISATAAELATGTVQYGFEVNGLNANPADDWGSVVVEPVVLSTNDFELSQVKAFPNPTNNVWNINTNNQNIQSIAVYDVLGKEVFSSKPNASQAIIDSINFSNGLYFAKVKTINGESNLRLVKN